MSLSEATPLLYAQTANASSGGDTLENLPVYTNIHTIKDHIENFVDVPLTDEQMRSPEIQFAVIRPLEELIADLSDSSVVYCLLLCRLHFLDERNAVLSSYSLNETRASFCELFAIRFLRFQARNVKGSNEILLALSRALVGGFHPLQGAPQDVYDHIRKREGYERKDILSNMGKTNALEIAILSKARNFIKSQTTQKIITAIWNGKVVYTSSGFLDIISDHWKHQDIQIYNISKAPILDHYRLRVPRYRSYIEFFSFIILFGSFMSVLSKQRKRDPGLPVSSLSVQEVWFFLYTFGYTVDKVASVLEHGWSVFAAGLTNGLDALCIPFFVVAFALRVHSIARDEQSYSNLAYSILSCSACLMFPRLAFTAISDNVLILSLRAMLADFAFLMGIAVFCFLGFVFALNHLCDGDFSIARIGEWLIFIWFGLDGTGLDKSVQFHPMLGPILFVAYAALSNTLLVSLLVAILSGTYNAIAADAVAEDMFRKAVLTFEGVKCDSLFDYVPPLNIIAVFIMVPISHVTSARWFHKINVAATRVFSFPILLAIAFFERQILEGAFVQQYVDAARLWIVQSIPKSWAQHLAMLEGAHWECDAVFDYLPGDDSTDESGESYFSSDEMLSVDEHDEEAALQARGLNRASSIVEPAITPLPPIRSGAATPLPDAKTSNLTAASFFPEHSPFRRGLANQKSVASMRSQANTAPVSRAPAMRSVSLQLPPKGDSSQTLTSPLPTPVNIPPSSSLVAAIPESDESPSANGSDLHLPEGASTHQGQNTASDVSLPLHDGTSLGEPVTRNSPTSGDTRVHIGDDRTETHVQFPQSHDTKPPVLAPINTHHRHRSKHSATGTHDRLPKNATGLYGSLSRTASDAKYPRSHPHHSVPLSSSAGRHESPLAKLYATHQSPTAGQGYESNEEHASFGKRSKSLFVSSSPSKGFELTSPVVKRNKSSRRLSLLSESRNIVVQSPVEDADDEAEPEPSNAQLKEMILALTMSVARLEKKLEGTNQ